MGGIRAVVHRAFGAVRLCLGWAPSRLHCDSSTSTPPIAEGYRLLVRSGIRQAASRYTQDQREYPLQNVMQIAGTMWEN